ncbi:MAG: phosphoenolpyruvate--protein phosphotransferase, partial [Devosiaceae bacterium]|nr:phosphoenolpyruvate--protein phosphotransferase [Devosiaceae bacterium MH13]
MPTRSSLAGPRVLLRRLRQVMAERSGGQERLDKITVLIASNMVAEVCSVYLLRTDGVLELSATEGLNKDAVHKAGLEVGEGLVGIIAASAEPLNLADAQKHPSFAYLPETGEEPFKSFLGVPVLRAGRVMGVLTVQNMARRNYTEEEVEALQTVAMVIAEMIGTGELEGIARTRTAFDSAGPISFDGEGFAEGIGLGHVVMHEPRLVVSDMIAENIEAEIERLDSAIAKLRLSIDSMMEAGSVAHHGEHRDILEAYRMFAHDRGWARRLREAVESGLTAEAAVERVQSDTRAKLSRQKDPLIRERLNDFDDLAYRLYRELSGEDVRHPDTVPNDAIVVARMMGAAELLDYDRSRIRGLVLEEGGPTSHITVIARAMGVPVVGRVTGIVARVDDGDPIILDGESGIVHINPPSNIQQAYSEKVRFRARRQAQYKALRSKPCITGCGEPIALLHNAGLLMDLPSLEETGAEGIGLFRTELQFMVARSLPRTQEQEALYARVLDAAGNRPVTFRTLDIGGDKVLPYMRTQVEENPALGWRAVRLGLDRPGLMRLQIRAMLKAASGRTLRIMFPMITEVGELDSAKGIVRRELAYLSKHGYGTPRDLKIGSMIEVPSLLYQLDALMARCDFVSVGSNDLFQFMTATDRGNSHLTDRFDVLSPSFLRPLKAIADAAT